MSRTLHVYGPLQEAEARSLRGVGMTLGVDVRRFDSPVSLAEALEKHHPIAVLITTGCDGAVEVMANLRGQARFA